MVVRPGEGAAIRHRTPRRYRCETGVWRAHARAGIRRRGSAKKRDALIGAIRGRPFEFVGQEQVALSTAPVWLNNRVESRRVSVRAYIGATGDSFAVLAGGLTRMSPGFGDPVVSMQSGGGSKDTWVLSDGPVVPVTLLTPSGQPVSVACAAAELPSRVADNLYWMGRYVGASGRHSARVAMCYPADG